MTTASLELMEPSMSDVEMDKLKRSMSNDLRVIVSDTNITSHSIGDKGDPITVSVILLSLINAGAINSLIDCIRAYIDRVPQLTIRFKTSKGEIELSSKDMAPEVLEAVMLKIKQIAD